ncbi:MAG TPA: hypothetical protein VFA81_06525 [Burkholderiales bacterium]|nr:hypothetical protein [Burkholderiales bacterium]
MQTPDTLKSLRERRERLLKRDEPRLRMIEPRDAWVLYAAYDLGSFASMPKGLKPQELWTHVAAWSQRHSSVLMVDANHKYFREKRGPVAMVTIDNLGWTIEPHIDFFFWATPRHRLAAAVAFLQMTKYAKEVGACFVRVGEAGAQMCDHIVERYDLLRPCGKVPNAREDGTEYHYYLKGRREKRAEMKEAA